MSWIERIQQGIQIKTGDGIIYSPKLVFGEVDQEFVISTFRFKNVPGTLVKKGEALSRRFALTVYFQGENNIDISEDFRVSAADKRPWEIIHPLYDTIICHPRSIRIDNTKLNVSKLSILVLETILGVFPEDEVSPNETIERLKIDVDTLSAQNYEEQILDIQPLEISQIESDIETMEVNGNKFMKTVEQFNEFRNTVRDAQRNLTTIITKANRAITSVKEVINYPFRVIDNVRNQIGNLRNNFEALVRTIEGVGGLLGLSKNNKIYVESQGATFISAAAVATITNMDFATRSEVDEVAAEVLTFYNDYLETLDSMQTSDSQTDLDSYYPDPDTIAQVQNIIYFTLSKLASIALDAQQEIIIINTADSNPVVLSHRIYGPDANDANLQKFIETNNIGLNEMLIVKKGRELVYFV